MLTCSTCHIEKEDSSFPKKCKLHCNSCKHKKYYKSRNPMTTEERAVHKQKMKEKYAKISREKYIASKLDPENSPNAKRKKNPAKWLYYQARSRAKAKGLSFDITPDDIIIPEYCPVFGFKLVMNEVGAKHDSMSLDRIIPELGYVQGNVRVISWLANAMKSNATEDLMIKFAEWVLANHTKTDEPV